MASRRLPVVVILGLTGAGKSKLALELAAKYNGEIISTDAMQIYKKLDIVTNKVTTAERLICPHHMIDMISPHTINYSVVDFRNAALPLIDDILSRQRVPFLVGGTNYYIEALLWKTLIDGKKECSDDEEASSSDGSCDDNTTLTHGNKTANLTESQPTPRKKVKTDPITSDQVTSDPFTHDPVTSKQHTNDPVTMDAGAGCNRGSLHREDLGRDRLDEMSTEELYDTLMTIDEVRARQLHPNNRRKIIRSIEVYHQSGHKISDLFREQHKDMTEGAISGPLRYDHLCVLWVQCEQSVLDARTDKRVEEMIEQGLIQELLDFHEQYNIGRIQENLSADYTKGIFQSIGFKEFHDYLMLSEEEGDKDDRQSLLDKGVADMKTATRQYSRYQAKWINAKFLKRRGGSVAPVYAVDSTDKAQWETTALGPASEILNSFIQGSEPPYPPLPVQEMVSEAEYNRCDICGVITLTTDMWKVHIKGNRHRRTLARHRKGIDKKYRKSSNTEKSIKHKESMPQK